MRSLVAATAVALLATSLAGCSTKGGGAAPDSAGSGGVKTGPGVTADTISLGILTDTSGPFAPLGKTILQAQQLYVDQVNAEGGVCDRKLRLVVRDHGYDVQKAVAQYTEIQPQVAGMPGLVGSSVIAALMDRVDGDNLMTIAVGYSSTLLGHRSLQTVGTTYDVDMVNGLDHLVQSAGLKPGDKVGHIYTEGEYGENALEGAEFSASKHGLTLVAQKVKPTDQDMTAQVTSLRKAGVKAVLSSVGPKQTASVVGVAAAQGMKVPFLSSGPGYVPQLLDSPVAPALLKMLKVASPAPAVGSENPVLKKLVTDYQVKYPGQSVDQGVQAGRNAMAVAVEDLKQACAAGDLSRAGIVGAHRKLKGFDLGVGEKLDFSDPARPSGTESYILQPKKGVPGGLVNVEEAVKAPSVDEYLATLG
ncbi:ABC transporter substrate-binding protein [Streptomyces sp. NPDC055815]